MNYTPQGNQNRESGTKGPEMFPTGTQNRESGMKTRNLRPSVDENKEMDELFEEETPAESEAEAIYDAKSFVESENAQVANRPKAGNFIELAFVREWSGKTVAALEF